MSNLLAKVNSLSLPIVILIASLILGGFYYASELNKQTSIERQQQTELEQKRQDQLAKDFKEQQEKEEKARTREDARRGLASCLDNATEIYTSQWNGECKRLGKLTSRCIVVLEMTYEEYLEKNPIPEGFDFDKTFDELTTRRTSFNKEQDECSCVLPGVVADRVNKSLAENKDECFKRYPQE